MLQDRLEISLNVWPDLLALSPVEVLADVHLPVELQHGLGVGPEHLQPVPHRLRLIVIPLDQRLTSLIIMTINFWWVEYKVVYASAKILYSV